MTPDSNFWTSAMSHSAAASIMHAFGQVSEQSSTAYGGSPCFAVHGELLKVFQINNHSSANSSKTCAD
jgi:hypothetical protein